MRHILNICLTALLAFPALLHAEQEERWYQVEIILFSHNNTDYHESELWPLDLTEPDLSSSRELIKVEAPVPLLPEAFSLTAKESLQLTETAERIKRASDVEFILHLGWVQPGLPEDKAIAVHIYDGMLDDIETASTQTKPQAKEVVVTEGQAEVEPEALPPKLDGTLRLILSRYHHLESNLVWREPLPENLLGFVNELPITGEEMANTMTPAPEMKAVENAEATNTEDGIATEESVSEETAPRYQLFRLQQSRRMRSNEVHYLDHPMFGIVALVTPYEFAETVEITDETISAP